jgi:hypothetical protein
MYPDHGSVDQLQMPHQISSSSNNNNNNDEDQTPISSGERDIKIIRILKDFSICKDKEVIAL